MVNKKLIKMLFAMSMLSGFYVKAQETIKQDINIDNKGRPIYWNHIKVNLAGLATGHYGLIYERKLGKKTSAVLSFDIPSVSKSFKNSDTENYSFKISGLGIQPEFRYYLGKNATRGYFIGAYLNYRKYNIDVNMNKMEVFDVTYADSSTRTIDIAYSGPASVEIKQLGIGFVTGAQFIIAKRVSLGFHVGVSFGTVQINQPITFDIAGSGPNPSGVVSQQPQPLQKKGDNDVIIGSITSTQSETIFTGQKILDTQTIPPVLPRFGITLGYLFGK